MNTSTNRTNEHQNENLHRYILQHGRGKPRIIGGASLHQFKGQGSGLHSIHLFMGVPNCGARVSGFLTWQFAFTTNTTPKGAMQATENILKRNGFRRCPRRRMNADTARRHSVRFTPAPSVGPEQKNCFAGWVDCG